MKKKLLPLTLALTVLIMAGAAAWIFFTEPGSRWLVDRFLRLLPGQAAAGKISGTLAGEMEMTDLRISGEGWRLRVRRTSLQWRPWELWAGNVALARLQVENPEILDEDDEESFDLGWPRLPAALSWFRGGIAAVEIRELAWRRRDGDILIDRMEAALDYSYGLARFSDLKATIPAGKITGACQVHLTRPFLAAELRFLPHRDAELPEIKLSTVLRAPSGSPYVGGAFTIAIPKGERERFVLKGQAAVNAGAVSFTGLKGEEQGRSGRLLGEGRLDLTPRRPQFTATVKMENLDLSRETGRNFFLRGQVEIAGDFAAYGGRFHLLPQLDEAKPVGIQGRFTGGPEALAVSDLSLPMGRGVIRGEGTISWREELSARWRLRMRDVEPSLAALRVPGRINMDLEGTWRHAAGGVGAGTAKGRLLNSRLADRDLTGSLAVRWHDEVLVIEDLILQGEGIRVRARGDLRDRIGYEVAIGRLSALVPGGGGRLQGQGWVRYRGGRFSGQMTATGQEVAWGIVGVNSLTALLIVGEGPDGQLQGKIAAHNLRLGGGEWPQAEALVTGTKRRHEVTVRMTAPEDRWLLGAVGAWSPGLWTGTVRELAGENRQFGALRLVQPATVVASRQRMDLGPLVLAGPGGERLEVSFRRDDNRRHRYLLAAWQAFALGRLPRPATDLTLSGRTTGELRLDNPGREGFRLTGTARVQGEIAWGEARLAVREADCRLRWREGGLELNGELAVGPAGSVAIRFSSPASPSLAAPLTGDFAAMLTNVDLNGLKPFLPERFRPDGVLSGSLEGKILPQRRFVMSGQARVAKGVWTVAGPKGALEFSLAHLQTTWDWRDDLLRGTLTSEFTGAGRMQATFRLPISNRYPLRVDKQRTVHGSLKGELREKGLLSSLFPGMVRETQGNLAADLAVSGTWERPRYEGTLTLYRAGAYLPTNGIRLEAVEGRVRFFPERIEIERFAARSGPGVLQGRATIHYGAGRVQNVTGVLEGERFQAAYLPEIQLLVNPRLAFAGDGKHLRVKGSVHIPEGRYTESRTPELVRPSRDVRVVDRPGKKPPVIPLSLDMAVTFTLGEGVFLKTKDLEGRLHGQMAATGKNLEDMQIRGEIHIAQGYLHAVNTKLPIERGHIYFKDKPFSLATLDILAVKQVGDVRAGFLVTGTIRSPTVALYSVPSLPDQDVLAYIAFGTSYTGDKIQATTLLKSAGMFLAQGKSGGLEDSLRRSAGLEVGGGAASLTRNKQGRTDMTTSLSTMGQYLSPQLYVGLARAMFSEDILYVMKYSFSRRWEVETKAGRQSSIDLYYKVEFD